MPRIDGLEILAELDREGCHVPVVMLSGVDDTSTVVNAMRKPFTSLPLRIFLPARPLDRDRHKMIEDHKDRE